MSTQTPIGRTPRSNAATTRASAPFEISSPNRPKSRRRGSNPGLPTSRAADAKTARGRNVCTLMQSSRRLAFVPVTVPWRAVQRETWCQIQGKSIVTCSPCWLRKCGVFDNVPAVSRVLKTLRTWAWVRRHRPASHHLSGGEAQRVAGLELCRRPTGQYAVYLGRTDHRPAFRGRGKIAGRVAALADGGNTVVVIEHNLT